MLEKSTTQQLNGENIFAPDTTTSLLIAFSSCHLQIVDTFIKKSVELNIDLNSYLLKDVKMIYSWSCLRQEAKDKKVTKTSRNITKNYQLSL